MKIQHNKPIPPDARGQATNTRYLVPLADLQVGDSVQFKVHRRDDLAAIRSKLSSRAANHARCHGGRFVTRALTKTRELFLARVA